MTLVTAHLDAAHYHQSMAAHVSTVNGPRLRALVIPREHGAWGMMLVPLATGAIVALRTSVNAGALALFIMAAVALFWLRTPVEAWLGTTPIKAQSGTERAFVLRAIFSIAGLAIACIALLMWNGHNRGLLVIGAVAALALAMQTGVKKLGRKGRMPAQLAGALGLTSTAAGAYCVATGKLDATALALWLANWLFAANQIHYVQVRIRSSRAVTLDQKLEQGSAFFAAQVLLVGAVVASCRVNLFPALVSLAFAPLLWRGTAWFARRPQPLEVRQLGYSELKQALLFGVLLCAAFLV